MNPEGASIGTILTFLGGFSLGGTVMFVVAFDYYMKVLKIEREHSRDVGYMNGWQDCVKHYAAQSVDPLAWNPEGKKP